MWEKQSVIKKQRDLNKVLGEESPILGVLAEQASPNRKRTTESVSLQIDKKKKKSTIRSSSTVSKILSSETKTKRFLVTSEEERTIEDLAKQVGYQVGTKVQFSQITRAMWALLLDTEDAMKNISAPSLRRPSNGNKEDLAEFEAELATYILDLFRTIKIKPK